MPNTRRHLRQRGFTLMETVLVIAIGLGLLIGGIIFYQQAQASSDLTDKTRAAVAISSEVRAQYRSSATFAGATTNSVRNASSLPPEIFNNIGVVPVASSPPQFTLNFNGTNGKLCDRLAAAPENLGARVISAECTGRALVVRYGR